MDTQAIGKRIRAARKKRGLTQEQAAKAAGMPKRTFESYERGELDSPAADKLQAIAEALGIASFASELDERDANASRNGAIPRDRAAIILVGQDGKPWAWGELTMTFRVVEPVVMKAGAAHLLKGEMDVERETN